MFAGKRIGIFGKGGSGKSTVAELVAWANRIFSLATISAVLVVLNRVADEHMERTMRVRLAAVDLEPIAVIPELATIALAWLEGAPLTGTPVRENFETIVDNLAAVAAGQRLTV